MVEIAISVLAKIAEYTVAPIGRQFGYLFCYNGNIEKLRSEVKELEDESVVVQRRVEAAARNCETIRPNVDEWLESVKQKQKEAAAILEKKEEVGKGCLNLKSRYWESRKATKRSQDLANLKGEKFNEVADTQLPLGIVPEQSRIVVETPRHGISEAAAPVPDQIVGSSSGGLYSRLSIMRDVMEAVKDDKIRMIGICGMGGVGKTTMVKEVEKMAKDKSMFDEVVLTTVSKEADVKKIQGDIAELLGLKFQEQNPGPRAIRLRDRLTQKGSNEKPKRILIILDDVWNNLDLEEVGIPYGDDLNGCKIILTSRRIDVCKQMKINTIFPIDVLPEEEAWILFQNTTYESLHPTDLLYGIAKNIVKECGGLPIAITTIATALAGKSKNANAWNDVLRQLQNSALEGEYAPVFNTLRVSYDFLDTKEIKHFFLLCCLFPEDCDIQIEDLVRYGMGLRLFKKVDNLRLARTKAYAHVQKLQDSNLLLDSDHTGCVRMHDLVRDFALWITSEDDHGSENDLVFMVKFGYQLKKWPIEDTYEYYTSISLQCDEMDELPDELKCPKLKLLQLVNTVGSSKFPETFFEGMEKLQVLALTMSIQSLPGSLKFLTNLRTLSLDDCTFKGDISMIGNLVNLEILSLVKSDIKELPREIRKLTRLRLLDLTYCRKLRRIAPDVLPSLTRLEELYMMGSSFRWAQQAYVDDGTNASFDELKQLSNLVNIEIDIPYEVLPIDLTLRNLQNFKISTAHGGGDLGSDFHYVIENSLELKADKSDQLMGVLNVLCRRTEVLYLQVKDLKNLPTQLERDGFLKLRSLEFESCNELVSIVNPSSNLEGICGGQLSRQDVNIPSSSRHQLAPFGNLQDLKLRDCNKLKNIFPVCIARVLIKLKSLEIKKCQMMEEIIFKERGDEGKIEFPQLNRLILEGLPNLISFCKAVEEVELPQLEYLTLKRLPKLTSLYPDETESLASEHPLFNKKVKLNKEQSHEVLSRLKVIDLENLPNLKHVWKRGSGGFQNLTSLSVERCERLETVFSPSIARRLVKERGDEGKIEFPQLNRLHLEGLPNLIGFSKAVEEVELPQLEYLVLSGVPKLTSLYPDETESLASEHPLFNKEVKLNKEQSHEVLSRFKEFFLAYLPNLKHVWKRGSGGFQNLKSLTVRGCERLETMFSPSIARRLVTLQSLHIRNCKMMESILSNESGEDENGAAVPPYKIEFPKLKQLYLICLPNLVCFSKSADGVELPQLEHWKIVNVPKFAGLLMEETVTLAPKNPFFNPKVTLTNLEILEVGGMDHLTTVFPALVIQQLHNLSLLAVHECSSVEVVFDLQGLNVNEGRGLIPLSRLNELCLSNLPKLTHVWKKGPHIIQGFQNLKTLKVDKCNSLRHLFTPSIAKILVALEKLEIDDCKLLEAIVAKEEGGEEDEEAGFLFPQLTTLYLAELPNLLTPTPNWLKWSSLKSLIVSDCGKESGTLTRTLCEGDISQQIRVTKVAKREVSGMENPNEISLTQCDTQVSREATNCERQIHLLNLHSLKVKELNSVEVVFNLQGLHVNEEVSELLTQLRDVELRELPKLTHVWKKSVHITRVFQNLTSLKVFGCDSLKHVFTYFMAKILVGLRVLDIRDCMLLEAIVEKEGGEEEECTMKEGILFPHLTNLNLNGLPNLLTIPYTFNWSSSTDLTMNDMVREGDTAQQLGIYGGGMQLATQLAHDKLTWCQRYKQTVRWLKLKALSQHQKALRGTLTLNVSRIDNLTTAFPANVIQQLQNLGELDIRKCSSLEVVFDIQRLNVNEGRELVRLTQFIKKLHLRELPKLTHVWKKGPHIIQGFQNLTTLTVDKCESLRHLFTPSIAKILVGLQKLKISDCELLEAIVTKEEGGEEEEDCTTKEAILFPQLTRLSLSWLPNLWTITPKPYTFNWAFLVQCDMKYCGKGEETLNDIIGNRDMARLATGMCILASSTVKIIMAFVA